MGNRDAPTPRQVAYLRILGKRIAEWLWTEYPGFYDWQNGDRILRGDASQLIEILQEVEQRLSLVQDSYELEPAPKQEPEPEPGYTAPWYLTREPEVPTGKQYIKVYRKFYHEKKLVPDYHMSNGSQLVERQPGWVWECHHPSHKHSHPNARRDGIVRGRAQEGRIKTTNNAIMHWVKYHTGEGKKND